MPRKGGQTGVLELGRRKRQRRGRRRESRMAKKANNARGGQ